MSKRVWTKVASCLAVASILSGCSSGTSGELTSNVLTDALAALPKLESYEVLASGQLAQDGTRADFSLTYRFVAPDRLAVSGESTVAGETAQSGLIIIGGDVWSLEGGAWTELPAQAVDLRTFSAERIWGLIPFDTARLQEGLERVNGVETRRYRLDADAELSFQSLAGALLAAGEDRFTGDLKRFTVDYWTDASGAWPVRMQLEATAGGRKAELTVDLARSNDPAIEVEPP